MVRPNTRPTLLPIVAFLGVYCAVLAGAAITRPCFVDECHFVHACRQFTTAPSLQTFLHYNEMSTPLPFVLYGAWGAVLGSSLITLRVLSLVIACATYLSYFFLFSALSFKPRTSFLLTAFLALNPYMLGLSVFVYTDMLSMLFLALLLLGMARRSAKLALIGSAGGLLCRQYFVFAVIAALAYSLWCYRVRRQRRDLALASALAVSAAPLGVLFALWKGFSPANARREQYLAHGLTFDSHALTLYVVLMFVYLLPVVVAVWRSVYLDRWKVWLSLALCWAYWLSPVVAGPVTVLTGVTTVGYFNRLLRLWPGGRFEQAVFFACFALALPILLSCLSAAWRQLAARGTDLSLLMSLAVVSFLVVMPWSYLYWEKYFLPLVPILAIQLAGRFELEGAVGGPSSSIVSG